MVYKKTPFGHIKNKLEKSLAIVKNTVKIQFLNLPISDENAQRLDIMKVRFSGREY